MSNALRYLGTSIFLNTQTSRYGIVSRPTVSDFSAFHNTNYVRTVDPWSHARSLLSQVGYHATLGVMCLRVGSRGIGPVTVADVCRFTRNAEDQRPVSTFPNTLRLRDYISSRTRPSFHFSDNRIFISLSASSPGSVVPSFVLVQLLGDPS